jgi:hypothetical protein
MVSLAVDSPNCFQLSIFFLADSGVPKHVDILNVEDGIPYLMHEETDEVDLEAGKRYEQYRTGNSLVGGYGIWKEVPESMI